MTEKTPTNNPTQIMQIRTLPTKREGDEWEAVDFFGDGVIWAKDNQRKLVTPNLPDFDYSLKPIKTR